jgi:putative Holliday junction resolvase
VAVVLGLDVGERRIGVAASDPSGLLASPLTTLVRSGTRSAVASIAEIVAARGAAVVVVGVPLSEAGAATEQARRSKAFGYKLRAVPGVRVVFWDERYSTATASAQIDEAGSGGGSARAPRTARQREAARRRLDAAAAAVILQDYLDQQRAASTCAESSSSSSF